MTPSIHNPRLRLLTIGLLLLVSACSNLPVVPVTKKSEQNWQLHQQQLAQIDHWEIHARAAILVNTANLDGDKVYPVGISWSRQQAQFSMIIEAPFGQGVIRIKSNPSTDTDKRFKLTLADGKYRLGPTPEALLTELLGWAIPVSGLKSWVKGSPQPETDYTYELYGEGRLKSMRQDGWLINYLAYFPSEEQTLPLPKRIYLKHKNLGIKIVIERWAQLEAQVEPESIFPNFD
jgi:outer membrane lipoprotein LolB